MNEQEQETEIDIEQAPASETIEERRGDWILTASGRKFWPLDPRPEEVCIEDIAHALSMLCRFTGHCSRFYSVAEHSLLVAANVPAKFRAWALLHDAAEAYVADMSRPLKRSDEMRSYREIEDMVLVAILTRFELHHGTLWLPPAVKEADHRALVTEQRDLMPKISGDCLVYKPFPAPIPAWVPSEIKTDFLRAAKELGLE